MSGKLVTQVGAVAGATTVVAGVVVAGVAAWKYYSRDTLHHPPCNDTGYVSDYTADGGEEVELSEPCTLMPGTTVGRKLASRVGTMVRLQLGNPTVGPANRVVVARKCTELAIQQCPGLRHHDLAEVVNRAVGIALTPSSVEIEVAESLSSVEHVRREVLVSLKNVINPTRLPNWVAWVAGKYVPAHPDF